MAEHRGPSLAMVAMICATIVAGLGIAVVALLIVLSLPSQQSFNPVTLESPAVIVQEKTPGQIQINPTVHIGESVTTRRKVCNNSDKPVRVRSDKWWQEGAPIFFRSPKLPSVTELPPGCTVRISTNPMPHEVQLESLARLKTEPFVSWNISGETIPISSTGQKGDIVVFTSVNFKVIP